MKETKFHYDCIVFGVMSYLFHRFVIRTFGLKKEIFINEMKSKIYFRKIVTMVGQWLMDWFWNWNLLYDLNSATILMHFSRGDHLIIFKSKAMAMCNVIVAFTIIRIMQTCHSGSV